MDGAGQKKLNKTYLGLGGFLVLDFFFLMNLSDP